LFPAGVFVGEAAQTMIQNVDYEIPYLRKQMAKCNQQMADADRRHAEYSRSAVTCANNYKKASSYVTYVTYVTFDMRDAAAV
jgi:hypothetical protein